MRWWWLWLVAVLACGPSNAQIKTAKLARYAAPPATLFDIARTVAARDYKIGDVDREHARFRTAPQMYAPDGGRQSPGHDNFVRIGHGSVLVWFVVEVLPADRGNVVVVTPRTLQYLSWSPKPRELAPDDPNLPGWVRGRVDALAVAIYDAAKQHAVP